LLTPQAGGALAVEAGFSDGASVEGLKVLVRDRESGAVTAEFPLPADGKLTFPIPAAPYRVVFEGGAGHRVSKVGPTRDEAAQLAPAIAAGAATSATAPATAKEVAHAGPPSAADSRAAARPAPAHAHGHAHTHWSQILLVTGVVFLFGAISFALGFVAGRGKRNS
jgi:hypothetical protein